VGRSSCIGEGNSTSTTVSASLHLHGQQLFEQECFGGKKFKIEIDSSIWREEFKIENRNRLRGQRTDTLRWSIASEVHGGER
jgi:hypothetical protein